jgi:thioredoxin 2
MHIVCPACASVNRLPAFKLEEGPKCGKCKSQLFEGTPVELTRATFDRHISRIDMQVVVDFWALWCEPCKMMVPTFARAAIQLEPQLRFAKVNTDQEQGIAGWFTIMSIPTLAIFRAGKEIARQAGALDMKTG